MRPWQFLPAVLQLLAQAAERCGLSVVSARLLAAIDERMLESTSESFLTQEDYHAAVQRALSADTAIEVGLAVVAQLQRLLVDTPDAAATAASATSA